MTRHLLSSLLVLIGSDIAAAQSPPEKASGAAASAKHVDEQGLSTNEEERIEAELKESLPVLAPIGDPARIEQLWALARKLTMRRAYCRATGHLEAIESMAGAITENRAFAAQAFYMCARTRLGQGFVAESAAALQRSMNIVGERPEHRDLLFKLAIVRAKEAMNRGDVAGVTLGLEEARRLGVEMGPGGGDRLADWAVPIIHETAGGVAGWSRDLLEAGDRRLADEVAAVALTFDARNRIASSVRRDIVLYTAVLPAALGAVGLLALAAVLWRLVRYQQVKRAAARADLDDLDDT